MNVYIWGTGTVAINYLQRNEIDYKDIIGFIQSERTSFDFYGKKVFEPHEILSTEYDYIFICVLYYGKQIYETCKQQGIPLEKLIFVDNYEWIDGSPRTKRMDSRSITQKINREQNDDQIKKMFPQFYGIMQGPKEEISRYKIIMGNGYDLIEKNDPLQSDQFSSVEYHIDYERYRTFELLSKEIVRREVPGAIAELGVFKGTFAKLINTIFAGRDFYLFDTFDSFDKQEFEEETLKGRCRQEFRNLFLGTSVGSVLEKMPYASRCIPRVGLFPDSAAGMEDIRFAFVSIDVDLQKSILEALRFFYPRLNCGGAIFVHDYNNRFLEGVKEAVREYEQEIGRYMMMVPIADEGGTLIILK